MKKSRKLKLSTIIAAGAKCDQVNLFRELFGEFATVTVELAESVADKFDWIWAANHLLSSAARKRYCADTAVASERFRASISVARKRYDADSAASLKRFNVYFAKASVRFNTDIAPSQKRFNSDSATACERFDADTTAAEKQYDSDTATAWKRRDVAIAPIWARTYINDGE